MKSSTELGLDYCNKCGECCRNPCFLQTEGEIKKLARVTGRTVKEFVQQFCEGHVLENGHMDLRLRRGEDGYCIFLEDNLCSIHKHMPKAGRSFACWIPSTYAAGKERAFWWRRKDLEQVLTKNGIGSWQQ